MDFQFANLALGCSHAPFEPVGLVGCAMSNEIHTRQYAQNPDLVVELTDQGPTLSKRDHEAISISETRYQFHVLSHFLMAISPVWQKILDPGGPFITPSKKKVNGKETQVIYLEDVGPDAADIFFNIIHHRTSKIPKDPENPRVPENLDFAILRDLAIIADQYDCVDVLEPWATEWCKFVAHPTNIGMAYQALETGAEDWLFIAHVFQEHDDFMSTILKDVSRVLIQQTVDISEDKKHIYRRPYHAPDEANWPSTKKSAIDFYKSHAQNSRNSLATTDNDTFAADSDDEESYKYTYDRQTLGKEDPFEIDATLIPAKILDYIIIQREIAIHEVLYEIHEFVQSIIAQIHPGWREASSDCRNHACCDLAVGSLIRSLNESDLKFLLAEKLETPDAWSLEDICLAIENLSISTMVFPNGSAYFAGYGLPSHEEVYPYPKQFYFRGIKDWNPILYSPKEIRGLNLKEVIPCPRARRLRRLQKHIYEYYYSLPGYSERVDEESEGGSKWNSGLPQNTVFEHVNKLREQTSPASPLHKLTLSFNEERDAIIDILRIDLEKCPDQNGALKVKNQKQPWKKRSHCEAFLTQLQDNDAFPPDEDRIILLLVQEISLATIDFLYGSLGVSPHFLLEYLCGTSSNGTYLEALNSFCRIPVSLNAFIGGEYLHHSEPAEFKLFRRRELFPRNESVLHVDWTRVCFIEDYLHLADTALSEKLHKSNNKKLDIYFRINSPADKEDRIEEPSDPPIEVPRVLRNRRLIAREAFRIRTEAVEERFSKLEIKFNGHNIFIYMCDPHRRVSDAYKGHRKHKEHNFFFGSAERAKPHLEVDSYAVQPCEVVEPEIHGDGPTQPENRDAEPQLMQVDDSALKLIPTTRDVFVRYLESWSASGKLFGLQTCEEDFIQGLLVEYCGTLSVMDVTLDDIDTEIGKTHGLHDIVGEAYLRAPCEFGEIPTTEFSSS
ncbi:hypothetical protein ABW19_dt0207766 [Dactylella cylindrospora]|nr:hypothetical protein ABW19_dt0207766 [Dactylella cylindrospora]